MHQALMQLREGFDTTLAYSTPGPDEYQYRVLNIIRYGLFVGTRNDQLQITNSVSPKKRFDSFRDVPARR